MSGFTIVKPKWHRQALSCKIWCHWCHWNRLADGVTAVSCSNPARAASRASLLGFKPLGSNLGNLKPGFARSSHAVCFCVCACALTLTREMVTLTMTSHSGRTQSENPAVLQRWSKFCDSLFTPRHAICPCHAVSCPRLASHLVVPSGSHINVVLTHGHRSGQARELLWGWNLA